MKEVDIVSKIVNREGGTFVPSSKGTQSIDLSDYLLKSIWDKVFEVRTDSQGAEYIFGKLPMVTQHGITMFSGEGVNVPSLASGLPFDGRTIWYNPDTQQIEVIGGTGGGSGEGVSNFWDLSGIPSWITNSKPAYSYSEITGAISTTELQNYLTSNSYLNVTSGDNRYLSLSGGTLSSNLTIQNKTVDVITLYRDDVNNSPSIKFTNKSDGTLGYIGVLGSGSDIGIQPFFMDSAGTVNKIWHEGNDGSGSGLDADLLDGYHRKNWDGIPAVLSNGVMDIGKYIDFHNAADDALDYATRLECSGAHGNLVYLPSKTGTLALTIDTVASAKSVMINYTQSDVDYEVLLTNPKDSWVAGIDALYHSQSKPLTYNASTGLLKVGGNILSTGGITMYSMRALKNVVDERGLSLSELSAIKPTRYTWKDGRDNRLHIGGIADDIQQVLPEVVYKTSDGILTMDYGNAAFAVASSLIKPVLDHEKRIVMLEEENKQLRLEIEQLKSA